MAVAGDADRNDIITKRAQNTRAEHLINFS